MSKVCVHCSAVTLLWAGLLMLFQLSAHHPAGRMMHAGLLTISTTN